MSRREGRGWRVYGRMALVALLVLAAALNAAAIDGGDHLLPATATALLCGAALLLPRLRWPLAPLLVTAATAWWGSPLLPLLVVVLFDLAVDDRTRAAAGCGVAALSVNVFGYPATTLWVPDRYAAALFLPPLAVTLGLWLGSRQRLVRALASDVEHLRIEAKLREEAAGHAERSRIAAEMHDVLAHRLSLIALHTGVLATRSGTLPAPVAERLALLRTTSVEALTDLRDILGALRETDAEPSGAVRAPAMREVRELVDEARAAGQRVDLTSEGHPEQAPTTHRLAVYRIVQEALTNARKHASDAPVTVCVDYRPPATHVEVVNTAGTSRTDHVGSGYGLIGLRERVTALGGRLNAGPVGAGTWPVAAHIPRQPGVEQNGIHT